MGGATTKEKAISRAQYLALVYSQSMTLYDLIPQSPHLSTDPAKPPAEVPIDGIVGSIQSPFAAKPAKQTQTTTPSTPKVSAEVNSIQSTQTSGNKKKVKIEIKNLETNRRPHNQPIMTTTQGKGRINTLVCYLVVTTSQRSVPVGMKYPSF